MVRDGTQRIKNKKYTKFIRREKMQFPTDNKLLLRSQYNIVTRGMESRLTLDTSGLRYKVFLLTNGEKGMEQTSVGKGERQQRLTNQMRYSTCTILIGKKSV